LLLAVFLGFNLATYIDYPEVWCDEVWFSEPAVNRVAYGSFTTMVYEFQPPGTFPAVNCPLYLVALVPWLSITGTSVLAIRSLNYVLMALGAFLVWIVSWRFNLVGKPLHRLLMVVALHLGYGMSFAYRCSRPDILGMDCLLLLLLSFQIQRRLWREVCIALFSALTVWIGLQVSLFAWFAALGGWLFLRRIGFREMAVVCLSMAASAGVMLLFFAYKGVLQYFLLLTIGILGKHYAHKTELTLAAKIWKVASNTLLCYEEDFTVLLLTIGLILVLVPAWKRLASATRSLVLYCAILVFGTPALFNLVGHYAFYYSYARVVPATLAFFAVWSSLLRPPSVPDASKAAGSSFARLNWFCLTILALALAVGLPLRLAMTAMTAKIADRREVQALLRAHIHPEDVVCSDYAYFFEVKRTARRVYDRFCSPALLWTFIPGRDLTPEQKNSVSVLVIRPNEKDFVTAYFGGQWTAESEPFGDSFEPGFLGRLPVLGNRIVHYLNQRQTERYPLQIFRKQGAATD
jgi:hypothetical protein